MELEQVLAGMPRLRKQATHEMVAAVLREAISTGVLRANQPLPQDEIASRLRVSHIPVREALRGAAVSALTPAEIREIYDIRVLLESAAVRRATPKLAAQELDRARAILDEAERVQDGGRWGALDVEFHQLVYHLQERPRLGEMIAGLLRREHRELLAALQRRDADGAAALLERHLTGAAELLVAELEAEARAEGGSAEAMAG